MLLPLLIGAAIGALATAAAARLKAVLRRDELCLWCAQESGHRVTGHTTRHCRGYVQESRRRRLDRIQAGAPWEPDYFGDAWLLPEEQEGLARTAPAGRASKPLSS